jgi:hypothetical protein
VEGREIICTACFLTGAGDAEIEGVMHHGRFLDQTALEDALKKRH